MTQYQIQQIKEKQEKLAAEEAKQREALQRQGITTQDHLDTHENRYVKFLQFVLVVEISFLY